MEAAEGSDLARSEHPGKMDANFRALFWKARLSHRRAGTKTSPAAPAHQDALRFACAHGLADAEALLSALVKTYLDENEVCLKLLIPLRDKTRFQGEIKFVEALARHGQVDHDQAILCYHAALASPGFSAIRGAWRNIGILQFEKDECPDALASFHRALGQPGHDDEAFVWLRLGYLHSDQGDPATALDCFRKASGSADCAVHAWPELGQLYLTAGDYPSAIKAFRNAIDHPDAAGKGHLWACLGAAHGAEGNFEASIPALKQALEFPGDIDPGETWHNLGRSYADLSLHRDAIDCYRKALNEPDYPHHALTWMTLAEAYQAIGREDLEQICWRNCGSAHDIEYLDEVKPET
jgi:tetratricopeptide (TPR) repeat protein